MTVTRLFMPSLLAAMLAGCGAETVECIVPPQPIAWAEVEPFDDTVTRTLSGVVRSIERAPLSFEVGGQVAEVAVEIGDRFSSGQHLARLDQRTFELALDERRGELSEAQARLNEAANDYDRQRALLARNMISQAAFDTAKAALNTARSQVASARARLAIARENLADTVLEAPYEGVVAQRLIEPSQLVAPGETVLEIRGKSGGLEVHVALPETLIDQLTLGSRHPVRLPTRPGLELTGAVSEIGFDTARRNAFPVVLTLLSAPAALRPGLTAEVAFQLGQSAASDNGWVAIPVTAFLAGPEQTELAFVFNEEDSTLSRREITVADIHGKQALVSLGLAPGEIVASKGLAFLSDGQRVERLGVGVTRYNP